jgi:oligopeptide transport system substrate-binding protein
MRSLAPHLCLLWLALPVALGASAGAAIGGCARRGDLEVMTPGGRVRMAKAETLRLNFATEPPTLDFQKMSDTQSAEVIANIMDTLVEYDLSGPEIALQPGLALKWEPSEGARKWRLALRPGVFWTDGAPFTARQVIDGWNRLLDPKSASDYAYFLFYVKNAKAFNEGKIKNFAEVGARATGPLEIEVELERPISYFPQILTHHSTLPVRLDLIARYGDRWTEPGNLQSLGPYKLVAWQHDKVIAMERNDGYWGEKAKIKYIVAHMILEQSTALNLFDAGQIDALNALPSSDLRILRKLKEYRAIGSLLTYFYGFNVRKPPVDNVDVRRAIARAIDRKQIVEVLAGGELPLKSILPPSVLGYDEKIGLDFDVAEARRLLAKAGYPDPAKFPRIALKTNANEDHQKVAENIQAQLRANLGINVEIQAEDWKVFLAGLTADPPALFRWGWLADYPDPDNFLSLMTSSSENNRMRWKNPEYDSLVERAASESDPAARRQLYAEAQRILVEKDVPVVPLYSGMTFFLINERVRNFPVNTLRVYRYNKTSLVSAQ